jgi:L-threonylcarbamoyladenylate synthase
MIREAAKYFKTGAVVIFPTDTVFGVGCAISKTESVQRIYKIRHDPPNKPQLILAASDKQAFDYGVFDPKAKAFAQSFWPGPLTIVVEAKGKVPQAVRGKGKTIGIRVPNQPAILEIISKLGEPIIAPSANFHGGRPPKVFAEIDKEFLSLVDYTINLDDLEKHTKMLAVPSTIIDLSGKPYKIVRVGAISSEKIKKVIGGVGK